MNILINCFHFPLRTKGAGGAGAFIHAVLPYLARRANIKVIVSNTNYSDYRSKAYKSIRLHVLDEKSLMSWFEWCDIYYDSQNGLTPKLLPGDLSIVTQIYDVQHEIFPHFFGQDLYQARHDDYCWAMKRSDLVLTISDREKDNIKRLLPGVFVERVYLSGFLYESMARNNEDLLKTTFSKEEYYLFPAVKWPHKNHVRLMEALAFANNVRIKENKDPIRIVMTGSKHSLSTNSLDKYIEALELTPFIDYKGFVSEEELAILFLKSKGLLFPSLYEGFGIPVVDAMMFGLPVIGSYDTCLKEIAEDKIMYFRDPWNSMKMAEDLLEFDHSVSTGLYDIEGAKKLASKYSVDNTADGMIKCFEEVLARKEANNDKPVLEAQKICQKEPVVTLIIDLGDGGSHSDIPDLGPETEIVLLCPSYFDELNDDQSDYSMYYYLKNDHSSKVLALAHIASLHLRGRYTALVPMEDVDRIGDVLSIAAACLDADSSIISVSMGGVNNIGKPPKEVLPSNHALNVADSFLALLGNNSRRYFKNFMFRTWALKNGGMLGSEKRISHFVNEKHLVI